jgi:hypothetical protein
MSPGGSDGVALWVSEMHIMRIGGLEGPVGGVEFWMDIGEASGFCGLGCLGHLDRRVLDRG